MKYTFSIVAIVIMTACSSGGGGGTGPTASPTVPTGGGGASPVAPISPSTPPSAPTSNTFSGLLNGARAGAGAGAVTYDARLGAAAQTHANDMLANNYFDHDGLDGSTAGDRIRAQGYNWRTWGENIARGQQSEESVFQAWQNSTGHRRNNLNPAFEDFGLAQAGSGGAKRWVLVFATER